MTARTQKGNGALFVFGALVFVGLLNPLFTFAHAPEFHEGDDPGALIITMTDDGYVPRNPVIEVGTEVIFQNRATRALWPASNFHPTHKEYPEKNEDNCLGSSFDACKPIQPGGAWWFTFNDVGEWGYHDHLLPGITGVITVVESGDLLKTDTQADPAVSNPLLQFIENIKKIFWSLFPQSSQNKVSDEVTQFRSLEPHEQAEIITKKSEQEPRLAWEFLKKASIEDEQVIINAHEMAHIVGNMLYAFYGFDGIEACDTTFAFGCFHGVTEQMFSEHGPDALFTMKRSCSDLFLDGDNYDQGYSGCVHGTGHGLATYYLYELEPALRDCALLGEPENRYCADGVYMEHSFSAPVTREIAQDPWSLCNGTVGSAQIACARYVPVMVGNHAAKTVGNDAKELTQVGINTCEAAPSQQMTEICTRTVGHMLAQGNPQAAKTIIERCQLFSERAIVDTCIRGAAVELAFQNYNKWEENAQRLCSQTELNAEECVAEAQTTWTRNHGT